MPPQPPNSGLDPLNPLVVEFGHLPNIHDDGLTEPQKDELIKLQEKWLQEIHEWKLLAALTDHAGWEQLVKLLKHGEDGAMAQLLKSTDTHATARLQGAMKVIQRLTNFRTEIGNHLTTLHDLYQRAFEKSETERSKDG